MGFGAAEATGLGFVCVVVNNPRVLSANRVYFGLNVNIFPWFTPSPPVLRQSQSFIGGVLSTLAETTRVQISVGVTDNLRDVANVGKGVIS